MNDRSLRKDRVQQQTLKRGRKLSPRRLSAYVAASLGSLVLVVAVIGLVFGDAILNRYGKKRAEREFAQAHPGSELRIGELDYSVGANRLVAQSVTLSAPNSTLRVGLISLTGVRWARLLWGKAALADVLARAGLEATDLDMEFPKAHYGIRCARLRGSVPGSELSAEGIELRSLAGDEAFFAARDFRTTRFQVAVPECRVSGLAYGELLQGKSYRAKSVHLSQPSFEALINRDKPRKPFVKSPRMVHEALASVRQPLQVDSLSITNGHVRYCERLAVGADPGVLTFGAVGLSVEGIANRGDATAAIELRGQAALMNAGTMKVLMSIPINAPDGSFRYSGSLDAMSLPRLNGFLDIVEHTRIKSGSAQEAVFEIEVTANRARGRVRAIYRDLEIAVLDKRTGTERGFGNRLASFWANAMRIRNSNVPNKSGSMKQGKVEYTRRPGDTFMKIVWASLRSGVMDVISQ